MKIFACHLLNDFSGSPKVLKQLVNGWAKNNLSVTIVTCLGRKGFLSHIDKVNYSFFWYQWAKNPILRLFNFLTSQFILFFKILKAATKKDIIYVNTVLPFGAAIAGKLLGARVIYHIHETTVNPKILKRFLFYIIKACATDIVYVSNYLHDQENIENKRTHILHNAIEDSFYEKACGKSKVDLQPRKNVLMICSLKKYKGVFEFVNLAELNPYMEFKLVVNSSDIEIENFFSNTILPLNLTIFPTQTNTHTFYEWAHIVLNLSRPDGWIETFGLTVLEAMAYRLPVIVPNIGGVTELVEESRNGFLIDCRDTDLLNKRLKEVLSNPDFYLQMCNTSFTKVEGFRENVFLNKSLSIINS